MRPVSANWIRVILALATECPECEGRGVLVCTER